MTKSFGDEASKTMGTKVRLKKKTTLARSDSKVTNTLLEIKVEDLRMLVGIMTLQPQQSSAQDLGHVGAIRITEEKVILNDAAPK